MTCSHYCAKTGHMRATYTFVVIKQSSLGKFEMEPLFNTHDDGTYGELKKFLLEQDAGFRRVRQGQNAREVVVLHVDDQEHQRWVVAGGRNGLKSKPVTRGQKFRSATEASGWIGLRHNEVAMLLSRCAATGEKTATVRGVTFAYADDAAPQEKSVKRAGIDKV